MISIADSLYTTELNGYSSHKITPEQASTVMKWLSNNSYDMIDRSTWVNYPETNGYAVSGKYAKYISPTPYGTSSYTGGTMTAYTTITDTIDKVGGEEWRYTTGGAERNKAMNIYDFLGNAYEWYGEEIDKEYKSSTLKNLNYKSTYCKQDFLISKVKYIAEHRVGQYCCATLEGLSASATSFRIAILL